jgi:hypothetical protein
MNVELITQQRTDFKVESRITGAGVLEGIGSNQTKGIRQERNGSFLRQGEKGSPQLSGRDEREREEVSYQFL